MKIFLKTTRGTVQLSLFFFLYYFLSLLLGMFGRQNHTDWITQWGSDTSWILPPKLSPLRREMVTNGRPLVFFRVWAWSWRRPGEGAEIEQAHSTIVCKAVGPNGFGNFSAVLFLLWTQLLFEGFFFLLSNFKLIWLLIIK